MLDSNFIVKIFVTGGAGFIGTALIKSLIKSNHSITIYDDFSNSDLQKINLFDNLGCRVIQGDILNYSMLSSSLNNTDVIIHLAAKIDVADSMIHPQKTIEVNVDGTINLLKLCLEKNIKKFITVSSSAVYGIPSKLPLSEESETFPVSPYGESKLNMENEIKKYSNLGIDSIILRLFNVYGPEQSIQYAGVMTKFFENIQNSKSLKISGDGSFTRDFIHINDVVIAITKALEIINNKKYRIYNICSSQETSILDLANLMIEISKKNIPIEFDSSRNGDISRSVGSNNLSKIEFDFEPSITLRNGIKMLFSNCKEY